MTVTAKVTYNDVPEGMARADYAVTYLFHAKLARGLKEFLEEFSPTGQTGGLETSFHATSGENEGSVWSDKEYALAVDQGSGEYGESGRRLRPNTAKALKFYWPKIGAMTIWKGDLPPGAPRAQFVAWALANGMVPFLIWPRGQKAQRFTDKSVEAISREAYYIMRDSLREAGAR